MSERSTSVRQLEMSPGNRSPTDRQKYKAMGRASEKTRAVDYVGFSLDERPEQQRILLRIVFQIGVRRMTESCC